MPPKISEIEKYAQTALKKWMKKVLAQSSLAKRVKGFAGHEWYVDISVCSAPKMAQINQGFRKKNYATDVLSFPAEAAGMGGERIAGDLAISVHTAARQATEQGHALATEIKVLMLHGLLHLAGYDHETDEGQMARRERLLRARLKLPQGLIERSGGR